MGADKEMTFIQVVRKTEGKRDSRCRHGSETQQGILGFIHWAQATLPAPSHTHSHTCFEKSPVIFESSLPGNDSSLGRHAVDNLHLAALS